MYGFAEELIKIRRNDQADSLMTSFTELIYFGLWRAVFVLPLLCGQNKKGCH